MALPREIKFRFWNIFQHKWEDLEKRHYTGFSAQDHFDELFDESNIVPQQYTGYKDSLGREIYEGDILKKPNGWVEIVEWGRNCGCCGDVEGFMLPSSFKDLELIGNIRSNPELIPDHYKHLR